MNCLIKLLLIAFATFLLIFADPDNLKIHIHQNILDFQDLKPSVSTLPSVPAKRLKKRTTSRAEESSQARGEYGFILFFSYLFFRFCWFFIRKIDLFSHFQGISTLR
jgi:hypothetical protein